METHALSVFNQVGGTVPPVQRIGPPVTPIFDPDTMPPIRKIKYTPTGEYHPVAHAAGEIHKMILDLLLRLHNLGISPIVGAGFRVMGGKHGTVNWY